MVAGGQGVGGEDRLKVGALFPFLAGIVLFLTARAGQAHFSPGFGIEEQPVGGQRTQ